MLETKIVIVVIVNRLEIEQCFAFSQKLVQKKLVIADTVKKEHGALKANDLLVIKRLERRIRFIIRIDPDSEQRLQHGLLGAKAIRFRYGESIALLRLHRPGKVIGLHGDDGLSKGNLLQARRR